MECYCVKCKRPTQTSDILRTKTKNLRPVVKGKCKECGSKKCRFLAMTKKPKEVIN